ncbi:DHA2 family efflux MFS transporter permease subunit [Bradyrhizobium sp. NC92]|uniref:DHA2 family efflux MFS transporter permease subunit n=1 Tax=Bradyrhizobium sp. (strain NC92) TaxID=55395 RepID=UPI0021A9DD90|nr:DHA2 family efflux MFS transporter permease subunit [Bradyrhizobium sp. NC92]UWU70656.1 DHA2 family efflux MFS transporter permease subunit [Bradyrhizobium sp. NC92]
MQDAPTPAEKTWVLALTSLASFMMALDAMVLTTAFAGIRIEFSSSVETLQWTVNGYNLAFAVLLLSGAALGDRFGRRRMFAGGIALFTLASAACALAPTIGWLIAARAAQGAGAALVMPLAMAILSGTFGREERAKALGIFSGITGFALIIGPAIGGLLTEQLGWRSIFWINLPIGAFAATLVRARLRESFGPAATLDVTGLTLVAVAALAWVWSLMRGNNVGWTSAEVVGSMIVGLVFAIAFLIWEARVAAPMVPLRLFVSRSFSAALSLSFLFYAAMYGVVFLLPQFLQVTLHFGAFGGGVRLLPWTATLFVTAPIAGAVVGKFGERPLVVTGLIMQAIGLGWIAFIASPDVAYGALIAPLVIAGVGVSMAMPAAQNAILSSVSLAEMAKASGIFNMGRFLGGMFGIAALVATFSANGAMDSAARFADGFEAAMTLAALLSLVGAWIGLLLPARKPVSTAAAPQMVSRAPGG